MAKVCLCLFKQINNRFFPSNSLKYFSAHWTTTAIASFFVYFFICHNLLSTKKKTVTPQCYSSSFQMTGFSVVRRHSVPSGRKPFYCISIGFFCCPPTLRPKVRHLFRILGASRTREMTLSIHFYYMQNTRLCQ